jgi:hypothetical protein
MFSMGCPFSDRILDAHHDNRVAASWHVHDIRSARVDTAALSVYLVR